MAKKKIEEPAKQQVTGFDMLDAMLQSFLDEVRELSKKKQDERLNDFKVKMINRVLVPIKELLASDPCVAFLVLLDERDPSSNSDAVLVLGQYRAAMKQFKEKHSRDDETKARVDEIKAEMLADEQFAGCDPAEVQKAVERAFERQARRVR